MKRAGQASESLELAVLLTLSGGLMDAYSYLYRGQVFANAQTGNILLLGVHLSLGEFAEALQYLCPIVAFVAGIALAMGVRHRMQAAGRIHWRQLIVLAEAAVLAVVAFLPNTNDLLANSLTSLACGAQVASFRKIHGQGAATTMCIGNLRAATEAVCEFRYTRDRTALGRGLLFFSLIVLFVCGAVLGNFAVERFAGRAILISCGLLLLATLIMFQRREENS